MENDLHQYPFVKNKLFIVNNYLEAVGTMHAIKSGISIDTIKRPISYTTVINDDANEDFKNSSINEDNLLRTSKKIV